LLGFADDGDLGRLGDFGDGDRSHDGHANKGRIGLFSRDSSPTCLVLQMMATLGGWTIKVMATGPDGSTIKMMKWTTSTLVSMPFVHCGCVLINCIVNSHDNISDPDSPDHKSTDAKSEASSRAGGTNTTPKSKGMISPSPESQL
jgi:hypothetical protein